MDKPPPSTAWNAPIDLSIYESDADFDVSKTNETSLSKLRSLSSNPIDPTSPYLEDNDTPVSDEPDEYTLNLPTSGPWTVPLYLNDYVVHVKYGIGQYTGQLSKEKKVRRTRPGTRQFRRLQRNAQISNSDTPPTAPSALPARKITDGLSPPKGNRTG